MKLSHRSATELERVAVDGEPVPAAARRPRGASDLLSAELDVFGRDRIYEAAVEAQRSSLTSRTPFQETESS